MGLAFGWKWVIAPMLGIAVYRVGTGMLRGLAAGGDSPHHSDSSPPPDQGRTLYWCEACGAELLLVVRGDPTAPRHCGERMHAREEISRN